MTIAYDFCRLVKSGSWQESDSAGWEIFDLVTWPGESMEYNKPAWDQPCRFVEDSHGSSEVWFF